MALENIFVKLDAIYKELAGLKKDSEKLIADAKQKLEALATREKEVEGIESALKILAEAKALKDEVVKDRMALNEDKTAFENKILSDRKKLAKEAEDLQLLRDLEKDLQQREQALIKEKAEYKDRIKKELVAHLKGGKE
jgi:ABC-type transporter Mla subunit MlaD